MDRTFSILVHGSAKIGKTTFVATVPKPALVFDAEGGWKFLPLRRAYWDPLQYAPPEPGDWDICIVSVNSFDTVRVAYQYLLSGQHPFRSIVVDSVTEVQRRCKQSLVAVDKMMEIRDWGRLLDLMDGIIRGMRDLTLHPTRPVEVVAFVAESRMQDNKWRPYMQGQIQTSLPYWMDVVGYIFVDAESVQAGENGGGQPGMMQHKLLVAPHPMYEAGERVRGRLGDIWPIETVPEDRIGNDIERMLDVIYPQP
jgi:hypothetical protein